MGWEQAKNILCVRLDTLGDVLMTTPAIRALKGEESGRRVTLLTSPPGAAVARLVPEIDEVMVYGAPWMKATPLREGAAPDFEMIEALRSRNFDACAIFTVFSQNPLPSAMLAYLAGVPLRLAHCRENPYQLLTDWVRETEPEGGIRHEVRRQLDLVGSVGCVTPDERMSLRPSEQDRERAGEELRRLDLGDGGWVAVHPGASASSRRYPPELFAEVVRSLTRDHGLQVVFTGSPDEAELIDLIRSQAKAPARSLAGKLSLGELAALLEAAPLLISNNTGPAHVAAAVGTPVVDLYALTNPQHTPWGVPSRVLNQLVPCAPCFKSACPVPGHPCLRGVPPARVVRETLSLQEVSAPATPLESSIP